MGTDGRLFATDVCAKFNHHTATKVQAITTKSGTVMLRHKSNNNQYSAEAYF